MAPRVKSQFDQLPVEIMYLFIRFQSSNGGCREDLTFVLLLRWSIDKKIYLRLDFIGLKVQLIAGETISLLCGDAVTLFLSPLLRCKKSDQSSAFECHLRGNCGGDAKGWKREAIKTSACCELYNRRKQPRAHWSFRVRVKIIQNKKE